MRVDVDDLGVDFLSISGHKIYGPKGIGVLYMRHGTPWIPWMHGGSQERRRRGGTLNVPGIMGLAKAMELSEKHREEHAKKFKKLREQLVKGLESKFANIISTNANCDDCVPHIINMAIANDNGEGLDGEMLLLNLDMEGIYVANGSACTSGAVEPSHVLSGIGLEDHIANSSIRLSFGKDNTEQDVDYFLEKLEDVVNRMKPTVKQ
jgi:cysteine desulfurase